MQASRKSTRDAPPLPEGCRRVVIEGVAPEIDSGRFAIKRSVGEKVRVEADVFADGHDVLTCLLLHRHGDEPRWTEVPMTELGNDRFAAEFTVVSLGVARYTITAWVDRFRTWRRDLERRFEAGQDLTVELEIGAGILAAAADRASGDDERRLREWARQLGVRSRRKRAVELSLDEELAAVASRYSDRSLATTYGRELAVSVDRERARFSTWYELFPRSTASEPGRHGTFADVERRLSGIAELGFDVLYLPPIHPIGKTKRKGRNNAPESEPTDPGSPWGIGGREGGHTAIHPELGTHEDLRRLATAARKHGLEIALDVAFQCSPDHPYVEEHPEWFTHRPDGSVQFAENPPKKYEDIYPLNFESDEWWSLWRELRDVVVFWVEQGVRIFRVDNPHTKPFAFWEWLIGEVTQAHPDVLFLSEAFTRPKVMRRLAKLGFDQSYTYFAWRNTKWELTEYFTELTTHEPREYFRPNVWPNTPDILTEYLQLGGRPAFVIRLVLAATLAASYGIYGPAFELFEARPREPGSEEYLNSEKYEIRAWDLDRPGNLRELIARVNRIRREHVALQRDWELRFHGVDNDQLICYSKIGDAGAGSIVCVVNLDPHNRQSGWVDLDLERLGLGEEPYQMHDLLGGGRFLWQGARNYVELDPHVLPAHVFLVRRHARSERDFEYYL